MGGSTVRRCRSVRRLDPEATASAAIACDIDRGRRRVHGTNVPSSRLERSPAVPLVRELRRPLECRAARRSIGRAPGNSWLSRGGTRARFQHVPRLRPPASADLTGSTCGPSSGVPIGRTRVRDSKRSLVCAGRWNGQCWACEFGFDRKLDQVANPHCRTRSRYAERHTEVRPFE
jgi:hypothetical protein